MDFLWTSSFSNNSILTHLTNIHYATEQEKYLSVKRSLLKEKVLDDASNIDNHKSILNYLKDTVFGPNLKTLPHNNIMILVGNDFDFHKTEIGNNNTHRSITWNMLDMYYSLINNHASKDWGVPVKVKIATPRDYFQQVEMEVQKKQFNLTKYDFDF